MSSAPSNLDGNLVQGMTMRNIRIARLRGSNKWWRDKHFSKLALLPYTGTHRTPISTQSPLKRTHALQGHQDSLQSAPNIYDPVTKELSP